MKKIWETIKEIIEHDKDALIIMAVILGMILGIILLFGGFSVRII